MFWKDPETKPPVVQLKKCWWEGLFWFWFCHFSAKWNGLLNFATLYFLMDKMSLLLLPRSTGRLKGSLWYLGLECCQLTCAHLCLPWCFHTLINAEISTCKSVFGTYTCRHWWALSDQLLKLHVEVYLCMWVGFSGEKIHRSQQIPQEIPTSKVFSFGIWEFDLQLHQQKSL